MNTPVTAAHTAVTEAQAQAISALADGRLQGDELAQTLSLLQTSSSARATWHAYHVVGDVLRSGAGQSRASLSNPSDDVAFAERLRVRLAQEPTPQARDAGDAIGRSRPSNATKLIADYAANTPAGEQFDAKTPVLGQQQAANDSFWKLAAGFASVVAVGALAWNLLGGSGADSGAQLAQRANEPVAVAQNANPPANNPNVVLVATPNGDMLRDARLLQMMTAHKQFGGVSALQAPAGFLRNATFVPTQP